MKPKEEPVRVGVFAELIFFVVRVGFAAVNIAIVYGTPGSYERAVDHAVFVGVLLFPWEYSGAVFVSETGLRTGLLWRRRWTWDEVRKLYLFFGGVGIVREPERCLRSPIIGHIDKIRLEALVKRYNPRCEVELSDGATCLIRWNRWVVHGFWARFGIQLAAWAIVALVHVQYLVIQSVVGPFHVAALLLVVGVGCALFTDSVKRALESASS